MKLDPARSDRVHHLMTSDATYLIGRVGRAHCCARPPSEPDVHVSMHPAQVSPLELIVSSSSAATRRPSVRSPPRRRPTCPRARTPPRSDRGAHLTRVSALSGPGTSPVSGQLSRAASGGASSSCPGFLLPFGHRHWLLGSSCSRPGTGPSSRSAYRAPPWCPDPDGVSTFRTCEIRPGWVPPRPRGRRCSPRPDAVPGRRPPLPSGQSLHPATASHRRGSSLRGINGGSRDSPVRPAPRLWPSGWDGRPLGFPLCSAPRRYQRRTTGRGRA